VAIGVPYLPAASTEALSLLMSILADETVTGG
jgi:hypothetical protein